MNDKLLSISIAAYNVEETIEKTVRSCACKQFDLVDVIVVDDGSTDGTDQVVDKLIQEYPDSVRLIKKQNGGYGTTIMASVAAARGKYFKVLDGDDLFDTGALDECLNILKANDIDVYVSPYYRTSPVNRKVVDQVDMGCCGVVDAADLDVPWRLGMHAVLFKTSLLRDADLDLPSHCTYTDVLYASTGMQRVKIAYVSHDPLYDYMVDQNDNQSTSAISLIKHRQDRLTVIDRLVNLYDNPIPDEPLVSHRITGAWLATYCAWLLGLLFRIKQDEQDRQSITHIQGILRKRPEVREEIDKRTGSGKLLSRVPRWSYGLVNELYKFAMRGKPYYG